MAALTHWNHQSTGFLCVEKKPKETHVLSQAMQCSVALSQVRYSFILHNEVFLQI